MENIVVVLYEVESEAYQAFAETTKQPVIGTTILSQVAHVKKNGTKIDLVNLNDIGNTMSDDTAMGTYFGTMLGVLGGPLGMILGGSTGYLFGAAKDHKDGVEQYSMIEFVAGMLKDGENALILLAQEEDAQVLDQYFAKFSVSVMRWDAAEVAVQVEEAKKEEAEMERIARQNMRKAKTDEFKGRAESFRMKLKDDFILRELVDLIVI